MPDQRKQRTGRRTFLMGLGAVGAILLKTRRGPAAPDPSNANEPLSPSAASRNACVILVHALGRRKSSMRKMAKVLGAAGFTVVNWDYTSTRQSILESARSLYECYDLNARYYARVHFVTHSLGGIVVRCMVKDRPTPKLGRMVMIAPPNQGSALARLLVHGPFQWVAGPAAAELKSKEYLDSICAVPNTDILIVAGTRATDPRNPASWVSRGKLDEPNDGTVSLAETRLAGVDNYLEVHESHTFLPGNSEVLAATVRFLSGEGKKNEPDLSPGEKETLEKGLNVLRIDPARVREVIAHVPTMPNVKMPTLGGGVWWADLVTVTGWRVQRNVVFGACRLLDPNNVRHAWGSKEAMIRAFQLLVETAAIPGE